MNNYWQAGKRFERVILSPSLRSRVNLAKNLLLLFRECDEILWTLALLLALPVMAHAADQSKTTGSDEFFIISSVDLNKHQLVLKHPTEVTELMVVNDSTVFVDDQGHKLQFKDLRAGDTVYVSYSTPREGPPLALRIRRAPMTLEELHRRYLSGVS